MARHRGRLPRPPAVTLPIQQAWIARRFPAFRCGARRGALGCKGPLQPRLASPVYVIEVRYGSTDVPRVRVIKPALVKDAPHLYGDGSLCLYWPHEWWWTGNELIADTIFPWAADWLYFYELWLDTGEWLGPSSRHGAPAMPECGY